MAKNEPMLWASLGNTWNAYYRIADPFKARANDLVYYLDEVFAHTEAVLEEESMLSREVYYEAVTQVDRLLEMIAVDLKAMQKIRDELTQLRQAKVKD